MVVEPTNIHREEGAASFGCPAAETHPTPGGGRRYGDGLRARYTPVPPRAT
ncbi:hypothetical protein ACLOJK_015370 [Asimina triloba]